MPKKVDHEARRDAIARAAAEAVAELGVEAVTTADLARQAGCTVGALPHYFKGKEAILLAALQYASRSIEKRGLAAYQASGGGLAETLRVALPIDAEGRRDCRVWIEFAGRALHSKPIAKEYRRRYKSLEQSALALLHERQLPRGWNSMEVMDSVLAFMDGLAMRALIETRAWPAARQSDALRHHLSLFGLA